MSIIIPIYNKEQFLKRCINSICNQTYQNLQIILIDDGSTDHSGVICEEYAKEDSRIEVYHTENKGVGQARNYGLSKVRGTYIQFVDGDDYITNKATEVLIMTMKNSSVDMVVCGYMKKFNNFFIPNGKMEPYKIYSNSEYLIRTLKDPGHHYYGVLWNKLYLADTIKKNNIQFDDTVDLGEDFIFNLDYIKHIARIRVIYNKLCIYSCETPDSLSRTSERNIESSYKELKNRQKIYQKYVECFQFLELYDKYKDRVQQYWLMFYVRNKNYIKHEFNNWSREELNAWENELENNLLIQEGVQRVSAFRYKKICFKVLLKKKLVKRIKSIINLLKHRKGI